MNYLNFVHINFEHNKINKFEKINYEFEEIDTRTIDNQNRLTICEFAQGFNRVRLYKNKQGEILIKPVVEIPASEHWLFQNKNKKPLYFI